MPTIVGQMPEKRLLSERHAYYIDSHSAPRSREGVHFDRR